jgi:hypothetical protein
MRIRMTETAKGAPDGVSVYEYAEGEEYEAAPHSRMSDELARVFIAQDLAVEVVESDPGDAVQADAPTGETPESAPQAAKPARARKR